MDRRTLYVKDVVNNNDLTSERLARKWAVFHSEAERRKLCWLPFLTVLTWNSGDGFDLMYQTRREVGLSPITKWRLEVSIDGKTVQTKQGGANTNLEKVVR